MNYWLPLFGLGALTAAVVIATRKDDANGSLPPARRTPGIPPLSTIGPPPGWATMAKNEQILFCGRVKNDPTMAAWKPFCAAWLTTEFGDDDVPNWAEWPQYNPNYFQGF